MRGLSEVYSLKGLCKDSNRFHVLTSVNRRQEAALATARPADSPTDCPVVYESVLVRERLLPLVFAVSQTGKVCENNVVTLSLSPLFKSLQVTTGLIFTKNADFTK